MDRQCTVVLNMIVKNESKIISRCLESVSWVDAYVITDTGSMDDTIRVIGEWAGKNDKDGVVLHEPWQDFGHNRTEAIRHAQRWCRERGFDLATTYLLFLDADMVFDKGHVIRERLATAHLWDIYQQNTSMVYANLRMARADLDIVCRCPTHEYYDIRTPHVERKLFEGARIDDIGDGGSKQDKTARDIQMLEDALLKEPQNCRYWFYLANSYRDAHRYHDAILSYERRIDLGGWFEELYCATLYKGDCHYISKQHAQAIETWIQAYQIDHQRAEALARIASYLRVISQHYAAMLFIERGLQLTIPKDRQLFLETPSYEYRFLYELSICAYYVQQQERGLMACEALLQMTGLPPEIRRSVEDNLHFYMES